MLGANIHTSTIRRATGSSRGDRPSQSTGTTVSAPTARIIAAAGHAPPAPTRSSPANSTVAPGGWPAGCTGSVRSTSAAKSDR